MSSWFLNKKKESTYLLGKDYPQLCSVCRTTIDQIGTIIIELPDEYASDEEGPCNYAYDNALFCGGHECKERAKRERRIREHSVLCTSCDELISPLQQYYVCYRQQNSNQDRVCYSCMKRYPWVYVVREDESRIMDWRSSPQYVQSEDV